LNNVNIQLVEILCGSASTVVLAAGYHYASVVEANFGSSATFNKVTLNATATM
jgi:hypothetical protein